MGCVHLYNYYYYYNQQRRENLTFYNMGLLMFRRYLAGLMRQKVTMCFNSQRPMQFLKLNAKMIKFGYNPSTSQLWHHTSWHHGAVPSVLSTRRLTRDRESLREAAVDVVWTMWLACSIPEAVETRPVHHGTRLTMLPQTPGPVLGFDSRQGWCKCAPCCVIL